VWGLQYGGMGKYYAEGKIKSAVNPQALNPYL